jgi:hypothetical protein
MDPRLIELNPRIDDPMPAPDRHSTSSLAGGRSPSSMTATLAGTRKQVGRWLVDVGTALEGGPTRHSAGTARR